MTRFVRFVVALTALFEMSQAGFGRNHVLRKVSKGYNKQLQRACQNPAFMGSDEEDQRRLEEDEYDATKQFRGKIFRFSFFSRKVVCSLQIPLGEASVILRPGVGKTYTADVSRL